MNYNYVTYSEDQLNKPLGEVVAIVDKDLPKKYWFKCRIIEHTKTKENLHGEVSSETNYTVEQLEDFLSFSFKELKFVRKLKWYVESRMEMSESGLFNYKASFNTYEEALSFIEEVFKESICLNKTSKIISWHEENNNENIKTTANSNK